MVNNIYTSNGRAHALGGLINGEVDNMVITSPGEADIYNIVLSNAISVSLSERYGLPVVRQGFLSPSNLMVGDEIDGQGGVTISKIDKRRGKDIVFPRELVKFNGVLVSTKPSVRKIPVTAEPAKITWHGRTREI